MMASNKTLSAGFMRISELMLSMINACDEGDKTALIKLSRTFAEDTEDFVGLVLTEASVTDEEVEDATKDDTEDLLRDAASAQQIRTASVKA